MAETGIPFGHRPNSGHYPAKPPRALSDEGVGRYLIGYAHLTNTRSLALIGDPSEMTYEVLFSFSSPAEKERFLDLVRFNDDLGKAYVDTDLFQPSQDEIRIARPLATVLAPTALTRALLIATMLCSSDLEGTRQ